MAEEQKPQQNVITNPKVANQFINVRDTDTGEIGSYPASQIQDLVGKGFEPVTDVEVQQYLKEQKYGTPEQQFKTALEGAASAATFGASTPLSIAFGVDPKDIQARAEVNPMVKGAGELVGLIGSSLALPGGAAAGAMERAGAAAGAKTSAAAAKTYDAMKALDLAKQTGVGVEQAASAVKAAKAAQPFLSKVGSEAANQAVQMAMFSAGDEFSKSFTDPHQTVGHALQNIGLNTLIGGVTGGAIGAVSPLWTATFGNKTETFLNKLKNRADGHSIPVNAEWEAMLENAPPEIRSLLSKDVQMRNYGQQLIDSGTPAGDAFRETLAKFQEQQKANLTDMFKIGEGKTAFEVGEETKQYFKDIVQELKEERTKAYAEVKDLEKVIIPDELKQKTKQALIDNADNFGSKTDPRKELFRTWGERIAGEQTVGDLDRLWTELYQARKNATPILGEKDYLKANIYSEIMDKIRALQDNYLDKTALDLAKATGDVDTILAAELAKDQRVIARESHKKLKEALAEITGLSGTKNITDAGQFGVALDNIPSIKFAEKLFDKKNVEKLQLLKNEYPEVFQNIVDLQKTKLLEIASKKGELNYNTLIKNVNELPKEIKELLFTKQELENIKITNEVLRQSYQKINTSNTSRGRDVALSHMGAGVAAMAATITGHNPLVGAVIGEVTQRLAIDGPAAIKLGLLKFLGSSGEVKSTAFKALVDYAHAAYLGDKALTKSVGQIFKLGPAVTIKSLQEQDNERLKLQKRIDDINKNPERLIDTGGETSFYAPDHAQEMSKIASNAVNYLNTLKPKQEKANFFDSEPVVSPVEKARYNRALDIANNPMIVLQSVKEGTITQNDVTDLKAMFPGVYENMTRKIVDQLVDVQFKKQTIPYQTKIGLAIFLGQPLDATMQPQAIQAAQNSIAPLVVQSQNFGVPSKQKDMKALGKMPGQFLTPGENRIMQRQTK